MTPESEMYGAIARGDAATVERLIAESPNVLREFTVKKNWLHWASQKGDTAIMSLLVDAGMQVDAKTSDGASTALNIAAGQGHCDACDWLINAGAEVNEGLGVTATPIFSAIYSQNADVVRLFIRNGADLTAVFGEPQQDVLSYARTYGTPEIVRVLEAAI